MTYCFAFNAEPDGIGIIADTRILIENDAGELRPTAGHALKIYPVGSHAFIAIAGRQDHLSMILWKLASALRRAESVQRYDLFLRHCENNFEAYRQAALFS